MRVFLVSRATGKSNKEILEILEDGGYKGINSIQSEYPDDAFNLLDTTKEEIEKKLSDIADEKAKEKEKAIEVAEEEAVLAKEESVHMPPCNYKVSLRCANHGNCPYVQREGCNPALNCDYAV